MELAPSPLNLPKRKNTGHTNHLSNFKILAQTVPDRVQSVTHALHRQTQTNRSWGHKSTLFTFCWHANPEALL